MLDLRSGQALDANSLGELIVCPVCKNDLIWTAKELRCQGCHGQFPIREGIPILLADQDLSEHDDIDHESAQHQKSRQATFFDRDDTAEFEISRPHNTPRLYEWLLAQKFQRSVAGVVSMLPGASVLTVCGGSGLDAELLARCGAHVVASDLSFGAARRCRERARRYGLTILSIVADIERLPFRDQSMDLVYVHDGLHHLARPLVGLVEMTRVSSRAVSVTEPASALLTAVAVRLRLAAEVEEAGNRVQRLRPTDVSAVFASHGFSPVTSARYAMYYPHVPGRIFAFLSRRGIFALTKSAWLIANWLVGRIGNKMTVQALRVC